MANNKPESYLLPFFTANAYTGQRACDHASVCTDQFGVPPSTSRFSGLIRRQETLVERYVSSGIFLSLVLYAGSLVLVVAVVMFLFNMTGADLRLKPAVVQQLLMPITIIIGLQLYTFIQSALNSYTTPIDQFCRLNIRISEAAATLFASIDEPKPTAALRRTLDECELIFHEMCYYTFRLFHAPNPNEKSDVERTTDLFTCDLASCANDGITPPFVATRVAEHESESLRAEFTNGRAGVSALESMNTLVFMLTRRLCALEKFSIIQQSDYTVIHSYMNSLRTMLENITVSHLVSVPQLFRDFVNVSLGVFTLIFVPVSIRATTDDTVLILCTLPLILMLVVGFPICKNIVGEPFDDSKRVATLDYRRMTREWQYKISTHRHHIVHFPLGLTPTLMGVG